MSRLENTIDHDELDEDDFQKEQQRERLEMEYRQTNAALRRKGRLLTYSNQQEAANKIIEQIGRAHV